jgi:alanine dehydrogenase
MRANPHLLAGLNAYRGRLTYAAVAEAQDRDHVPAVEALAA